MRPGEGKTALILDLAGISHDLGLPDDVREWDLADGEIRQPHESAPDAAANARTARRCSGAAPARNATTPNR